MDIYSAIQKMWELTEKGEPFSLTFMSYSMSRNESHGIRTVEHVRLCRQRKKDRSVYAPFMLSFTDMDDLQDKNCWIPLLMEFNGEPLTLNMTN